MKSLEELQDWKLKLDFQTLEKTSKFQFWPSFGTQRTKYLFKDILNSRTKESFYAHARLPPQQGAFLHLFYHK